MAVAPIRTRKEENMLASSMTTRDTGKECISILMEVALRATSSRGEGMAMGTTNMSVAHDMRENGFAIGWSHGPAQIPFVSTFLATMLMC
mmetsp:Transcript_35903/g.56005  ORF Transcript_35903/g.56005 Transcript_35903/m.56005 type:complete len:90 (+) Transcript_35903:50-319(+)